MGALRPENHLPYGLRDEFQGVSMGKQQISISLDPSDLAFLTRVAERESRTPSGQARHFIAEARRQSGAAGHHGDLVPLRLLPQVGDLPAARTRLAELDQEIARLEEVANPPVRFHQNAEGTQKVTVAQHRAGLTLEQETRLREARNEWEVLDKAIRALEKLQRNGEASPS
jgi:hypothetical protein